LELKTIASVVGVLGFLISVATFVLTRMERRKKLVVEIFKGHLIEYKDELILNEDQEYDEIVKIRITNIGGRPVIVDAASFYFMSNGNKFERNDCDWLGIKKVPSPLPVGQSNEVAVHLETFESLLKMKDLDKYCNENDCDKTVVKIEAGLKDIDRKAYKSKGFQYFYYVGDLSRTT